jgi:protein-S-isoprenylcysteine O-methyltransferase Ste14
MKPLLLLLVALNFTSFLLSIMVLFKKNPEMRLFPYRLLKVTSVCFWIFSITLFLQMDPLANFYGILLATVQVFCLISFWINFEPVRSHDLTYAFSKNIPSSLLTSGYYKWIRHPYYMIYMLCYISLAIVINNVWLAVLLAVIMGIYWDAAKYEEAKFESSELRDAYSSYRLKTGMFFPNIFKFLSSKKQSR